MGTYRLRVPASRVGYVPDAHGGLPPGPTYCTYGVHVHQPRALGTYRVPWHPRCAAEGAVYSLHKTSTRAFIKKKCTEWGCEATVVAELKFEIPKMYKHHRKASVDVNVDFWRVVPARLHGS